MLSHPPCPWPFTLHCAHTAVGAFAAGSAPHSQWHLIPHNARWLYMRLGLLSPLPSGCWASTDVDFSAPHSLSNTLSLRGYCHSLACFLSVPLWCKCMFCADSWVGLICHLAQPISTSPWTVARASQAVRANACAYCRGPMPMPSIVFKHSSLG